MMALSKHSKEFAAKKDVFSPKRSWGELQFKGLACLATLPLGRRDPWDGPLPSPPGTALHHQSPLCFIKKNLGYKKKNPAE